MPVFVPDAQFNDPNYSNQQKMNDATWGLRSRSGAGKAFLQQDVPRLGANWKPIPGVNTSVEMEIGALPQNFAVVLGAIANLSAKVDALAAKVSGTPAVVDVQNLAAQLAPLLNANVAEQVMTIIRAQINK